MDMRLGGYRATRVTFYLIATAVLGLSADVMDSAGLSQRRILIVMVALVLPVRWLFYTSFDEFPRVLRIIAVLFRARRTVVPPRPDSVVLSRHLLSTLLDKRASSEAKYSAFQQMLELDAGWWGSAPIKDYAIANALAVVRSMGSPYVEQIDVLDREDLAERVLSELYYNASRLDVVHPNALLRDVAKQVILWEIEKGDLVVSSRITQFPDFSPSPREASLLIEEDSLIDAIRSLPDSLRLVAQFHFVHRYGAKEIGEILGIDSLVVRHRIRRVRETLAGIVRKEREG